MHTPLPTHRSGWPTGVVYLSDDHGGDNDVVATVAAEGHPVNDNKSLLPSLALCNPGEPSQ